MTNRSVFVLGLSVFCLVIGRPVAADWPGFLGGTMGADADVRLPLNWSADSGVTWRTPLPGHGQSSPVQVGGIVYVTAIEGPNKETNLVLAFDLGTGKELWRHESESRLPVKNNAYTCRAAPTPVADEAGVYAFFESGNFVALDAEGKVRWERSLVDEYGKYEGRFGIGGSLAQLGDQVFVLADNDGPAYLLSLEKATGKTLWKTDRESRTAWSSPIVVPVGGKPQIVVSAAGTVDGYEPTTGKLLWTLDGVGGNTVASPAIVSDGQVLIGASPGRNGESSEGAKQSNLLLKINVDGEKFTPEVVWRNTQATSSFGSPISHGAHAYYTNRAGVLYCIDLATGETAYTARIAESNWATPLVSDDRIYFFGKSGTTTVMAAGGEKKQLAENKLYESQGGGGPGGFDAEIQYGVAATPKGTVVRTGSNLYLIGSVE